jgi:hypothetical protein
MKSRLARIAAILGPALLLIGCAPIDSIFPLYKADDAVFDDRLLGSWQYVVTNPNDSDKNQRWIFSHTACDAFYDFRLGIVEAKGGFFAKARLVRLENNLFIDFEGDSKQLDDEANKDSIIPFPMITAHMIGRVWLEKDTLQIHFLSDDWVKKQVAAGTLSLAHLAVNGGQILTAETEDLRKYMRAHADDKEALSDNYEFVRAK